MNQQEFVSKLIEQVRRVAERPAMYLGDVTIASALGFQRGIYCACSALSITLTSELRSEATNSLGWESSSTGGVDRMQAQGLSEEQIAKELLRIEIKMLEIVAAGLEA